MKTKNEIIKELFGRGQISFDEALTLASNEQTEEDLITKLRNNPDLTDTHQDSKEATLQNFISELIDEHWEEADGDRYMTNIDTEKCAKIMKDLDWKWRNQTVTTDMIRTDLKDDAYRCIKEVIKQIGEGTDEPYWYVEGGGFKTEAYLVDDQIEVRIMFIAEETAHYIDINKIV